MFSPAAMLDAARQINYFFIVKQFLKLMILFSCPIMVKDTSSMGCHVPCPHNKGLWKVQKIQKKSDICGSGWVGPGLIQVKITGKSSHSRGLLIF